jgi:hypothetical protein
MIAPETLTLASLGPAKNRVYRRKSITNPSFTAKMTASYASKPGAKQGDGPIDPHMGAERGLNVPKPDVSARASDEETDREVARLL